MERVSKCKLMGVEESDDDVDWDASWMDGGQY